MTQTCEGLNRCKITFLSSVGLCYILTLLNPTGVILSSRATQHYRIPNHLVAQKRYSDLQNNPLPPSNVSISLTATQTPRCHPDAHPAPLLPTHIVISPPHPAPLLPTQAAPCLVSTVPHNSHLQHCHILLLTPSTTPPLTSPPPQQGSGTHIRCAALQPIITPWAAGC